MRMLSRRGASLAAWSRTSQEKSLSWLDPPFLRTLFIFISHFNIVMTSKTCTKCRREQPLTEFTKHAQAKDGLNHWCKSCSSERGKVWRASPSGIYTSIKGLQKFWDKKPVTITRVEFIEWYTNQEKICHYCDLPEEYLQTLGDSLNEVTSRLTVDCMDNGAGYVRGNIVLACMRCNNTKSDIISYEDMKVIAQKYIKPVWVNALKTLNESVK